MSKYTVQEIINAHKGKRIAIVGNGASVCKYETLADEKTRVHVLNFQHLVDQDIPVWTVNGGWVYHPYSSLGWHMDDLKHPEIVKNVAEGDIHTQWYLDRHADSNCPIFTATEYEEYPPCVAYPLKEIVKRFNYGYFSEGISYAIAFAVYAGVKGIDFFGCDYWSNADHERNWIQERCSTEFWCGVALASGIDVRTGPETHLLKNVPKEPWFVPGYYGYLQNNFPLKRVYIEGTDQFVVDLAEGANVLDKEGNILFAKNRKMRRLEKKHESNLLKRNRGKQVMRA